MAESRNYFHGYCRSKDFLSTIKNCFLSATCGSRPWTLKDEGDSFNVPKIYTQYTSTYGNVWVTSAHRETPYFVITRPNKRGEVDDFLFYDAYTEIDPSTLESNDTYGAVYVHHFPEGTYDPTPGSLNLANSTPAFTFQEVKYHSTLEKDLPWLPQYVWYWIWTDEDCFYVRAIGNVGGEGSATSSAGWAYHGFADPRSGDNSGIPFSEIEVFLGSLKWVRNGDTLGDFLNKAYGPSYWVAGPANTFDYPMQLKRTSSISYLTPPTINADYSHRLSTMEYGSPVGDDKTTALFSNPSNAYNRSISAGQVNHDQFTFNAPTRIDQICYHYTSYSSSGTINWKLLASNDEITWDTLLEVDSPSSLTEIFEFTNNNEYLHYRIDTSGEPAEGATYLTVGQYFVGLGNMENKPAVYNISKVILSESCKHYPSGRVYTEYPWVLENEVLMISANNPTHLLTADLVTNPENGVTYSFHSPYLMKSMEGPMEILGVYSGGAVTLTWTNPTRAAGVRVVRSEDKFYMKTYTDGDVLHDDTSPALGAPSSFVDSTVTSGKTYNYAVIAYDSNGNESMPHEVSLLRISIP